MTSSKDKSSDGDRPSKDRKRAKTAKAVDAAEPKEPARVLKRA
jgi:hypothetical protein